ncbi:BTB/POZ domain-containing protein At1g03010 [Linum perenne]
MGVVTVGGELKPSISGKRGFRPSSSIRHATEWPISDVSSDLTVEVSGSTFALHKFPLVSRSGKIRKLLLESKDSKLSKITIHGVPGGAEAFEAAAKFCYGVHVEITLSNVAMLRCASHFLEMSEDFAEKNMVAKAESFLKDTVLPSISNTVSVLHRCEALLPVSEEINLVNRLVTSIANNACKEQLASGLLKLDHNFNYPSSKIAELPDTISPWWGESLSSLSLDLFQRVLTAVKSKGLKQDMISKILMNYAHVSLQEIAAVKDSDLQNSKKKKQRVIVETIVGLLPTQSRKSHVPMAFLASLLKTAISASASSSCRSDLERRIGLQLDQAILEDVLIPTNSYNNNNNNNNSSSTSTMYDTDSILRIFSFFLNLDDDDDDDDDEDDNRLCEETEMMMYDFDSPGSPKQSSILKVSKLLDNYLAEVALDSNLQPLKFIALAELLPDHARIVSDGLYRAVDIFLKDSERYRLCKTIDSQKLSQEACSHAAQNERLPVQMAVQVLYFEQIRLRNAMNGGGGVGGHNNQFFFGASMNSINNTNNNNNQFPHRSGSGAGSGAISPRDNYASVRRENRELKLEVARMRMRLTDLEKDHVSIKQELVRSHPANKLFKSFAKKLGKLNALFRINSVNPMGGKASSEARKLEQEVETVVKVLQPGPLGIIEHKFSNEEIREANATVQRAVENWRRNSNLEQRNDFLKDFVQN